MHITVVSTFLVDLALDIIGSHHLSAVKGVLLPYPVLHISSIMLESANFFFIQYRQEQNENALLHLSHLMSVFAGVFL